MSGWRTIDSAPTDGTQVRLAHRLDPSSLKPTSICPVYGKYEGGEWVCNAGFVCSDGMFRFTPTHWWSEA